MASYTPNHNLGKPNVTDPFGYSSFLPLFNDNMDKIDQIGGGNQNIATDYDDTQTYAVGDYVIYDGLLYKCDTAVTTAETFDPTKWTHVVVTDEMGSGGGSGGHTIYDKDGTALAQENGLQFTGAVSVSDDSVNGRTVVDVEGGGNYYLNTLYSTEEKKIGYWTDGKPLYQKTLVINNLNLDPSGTAVDITSLGVDMCCPVYEGSYYIVSGVKRGFARLEYQQPNEIYLYPAVNRTGTTCFITLQYTKTTDTADPNPQFGNVIYLPTIYSEEEREVGAWRDGKPLYQKTYTANITANTQWIDTGLDSGDLIVRSEGTLEQNNGQILTLASGDTEAGAGINTFIVGVVTSSKWSCLFRTNNNDARGNLTLTLYYTKGSDVAGSGIWNGQGGYAHHYSTSEKVIGTWIDGKPLYEKTYTGLNQSITGNQWNTISGVSMPINEIIDVRAYRIADGHLTSIGLKEYSQITQSGVRLVPLSTETLDTLIIQYTKTTDT